MATTGESEYKGHPQPPVDERLAASKNFLADEDQHRCLNFDSKITEIEDYVAHIENENIPCDPRLLKDVKIMLETQRDWERRLAEGPAESTCHKTPSIQPYSSRLISNETALMLERQKAELGVVYQTREDHAVFTADREVDHREFLQQMRADASQDPEEINTDTNLLWVESRAYGWAVNDPAMIPYWMHPTMGIPKKAPRLIDEPPWYRDPVQTRSKLSYVRPARGWIPDYLLVREKKINALLKKSRFEPGEYEFLEELLYFHEPKPLRELHDRLLEYEEGRRWKTFSPSDQEMAGLADEFEIQFAKWVSFFQAEGVYLMVRSPNSSADESTQSGVFYVDHGLMDDDRRKILHKANDLLARWCEGALYSAEYESLKTLFSWSWPAGVREIMLKKGQLIQEAGKTSELELNPGDAAKWKDLDEKEKTAVKEWKGKLKDKASFRYLRPGEIAQPNTSYLYIPWSITTFPRGSPSPRPESQLTHEALEIQRLINLGFTRGYPTGLDDGNISFILLLQQVTYPRLRALLIPYLEMRGKILNSVDTAYFDELKPLVNLLWNNWIEGLSTGQTDKRIKVRMPRPEQSDEDPSVLSFRPLENSPNKDPVTRQNTIVKINDALKKQIDPSDPNAADRYYQATSELLKDFHYKYLRNLFAFKEALKSNGADLDLIPKTFDVLCEKWINSKRNLTVTVKTSNEYVDPDCDPAVVYYRGPLKTLSELDVALTDDFKKCIRVNGEAIDFTKERNEFHPVLQKLIDCDGKHAGESERILQWYVRTLRQGQSPPIQAPVSKLPETPEDFLDEVEEDADEGNVILDPMVKAVAVQQRRVSSMSRARYESKIYKLMMLNPVIYERIRAIETELRRLLRTNTPPKGVLSMDFKESARLYILLEQFMNFKIYTLWQRYKRVMGTGGPDEVGLRAEFRRKFLPWLRSLFRNDISVLPPFVSQFHEERRVHFQSGTNEALVFQRRSSLAKPGLLSITAPKCDIGFDNEASTAQAQLVVESWKIERPEPAFTPHPWTLTMIDNIESRINELLPLRGQLTWDESEELVENLRHIMHRSLVFLDMELLTRDNSARRGDEMNVYERSQWWERWSRWKTQYGRWLSQVPDVIRIDRGVRQDFQYLPDAQGRNPRFRFQILPEDMAVREERRRELPGPIKHEQDLINKILKDNFGIGGLSQEDHEGLILLLHPLYREIGKGLRSSIHKHIEKKLGISVLPTNLAPEDTALIETMIDEHYAMFITALMNEEPFAAVETKEELPGDFELTYTGRPELVTPSQSDLEKVWPTDPDSFLSKSREEFYDLASRIRNLASGKANQAIPLTQQEISFLDIQFRRLSYTDRLELLQDVVRLLQKYVSQNNTLSAAEKDELAEKDTRLLWNRWAIDNKNLVDSVFTDAEVVDPADHLTSRRLAGSRPPPTLPTISRPNEVEVKELEIELNNLIAKRRNGNIRSREQAELRWLIIAFLPPALKYLKYRMDEAEVKFLRVEGLSQAESIEMVDERREFETELASFLDTIPRHGMFLDPNWFSPNDIAEACSRARVWRETTQNSNKSFSYPITSNYIEDPHVRALHDIYAALIKAVNQRWDGDADLQRQFLVNYIPQNLRALRQELDHPSALQAPSVRAMTPGLSDAVIDDSGVVVEALRPLHLERDFIAEYMSWLKDLPFPRLQSLLGASAVPSHDFTSKAERRGIQRAAIELSLNLLATNQEQHRPSDGFRVLDVSGQQYYAPDKEVPISLPLEPWKRPLEANPFEYTKKMLSYRRWKDSDYDLARARTIKASGKYLDPPANYLGPFALADGDTYMEAARKKQARLAEVAAQMQEAQLKAPRPQMGDLIATFSQGLANPDDRENPLYDEFDLPENGIDLLVELSGPSWDEDRLEYTDPAVVDEMASHSLNLDPDLLDEFELEVKEQIIPLRGDSTQGLRATALLQGINNVRINRQVPSRPWSRQQGKNFLLAMHFARRIDLTFHGSNLDDMRVWKIPLSGHPENKYVDVIPRLGVEEPPGIKFEGPNKQAVVTYDFHGHKGPPIYQPNKGQYLLKLAWRLGRDLRKCMDLINSDNYVTVRVCLREQYQGLTNSLRAMADIAPADRSGIKLSSVGRNFADPNGITLKSLAMPLTKLAPDLIREADPEIADPEQMTEQEAAQLLQKQIIEEVSNNWELRFPENEHVWDFAGDRLAEVTRTINGREVTAFPRVRRFFDMRRFPPGCQSDRTKAAIEQSGPIVQEKPKPVEAPEPPLTQAQMRAQIVQQPVKKDRHIQGQRPNFPFGETPYQAAYQSFRMEQDLKDVPEFQPQKRRRRFFSRRNSDDDKPRFKERYPLPELPMEWQPDNISVEAKRHQILSELKRAPGWPSPDVLEYYHTQEEIQNIKAQDRWDRHVTAVQIANHAIEKATGRKIATMTAAELNTARAALGIDLTMGTFPRDEVDKIKNAREDAAKKKAAAAAAAAARAGTGVLQSTIELAVGGPARRRTSRSPVKMEIRVEGRMAPPSFMRPRTSPRKRAADAATLGEASPKKQRGK